MGWFRKKPKRVRFGNDPIVDEEIAIGGLPSTSLRECAAMAEDIADRSFTTPAEKGLAVTVIYLIDRLVDAERRAANGQAN